MAASATVTSNVPAMVTQWADSLYLLRAMQNNPHTQFAYMRRSPGVGSIVRWRRLTVLAVATTALTEGVTPASVKIAHTTISATVSQFGNWTGLSDVLLGQNEADMVSETLSLMGQNTADTYDTIVRDILDGATGVVFADASAGGNATSVSVGASDVVTLADYRAIVTTMKGNDAKKLSGLVTGTDQVGTAPLPESYFAIIHTDSTRFHRALSGWQDVQDYADGVERKMGEVGRIEDIRFIETSNATLLAGSGASAIDLYTSVVIGQQAYGMTTPDNTSLRSIVKALGSGGTDDALDQVMTVGWKGSFASAILNQNFLRKYEYATG